MIPLLGVEWLIGNYKVHWFHGEAMYSALRRKYDLVTEDGVTPVRRWVGGTTEKPVYAYLVAKHNNDHMNDFLTFLESQYRGTTS